MKPHLLPCLALLGLVLGSYPALADSFAIDQLTDVAAPSTRGAANTTFFGWETFDDPGTGNPINDTTPNIGTTTTGVTFATTNGENHRSGSGNIYVGATGHTLYEQITVATDGTAGTNGTTTIIAQFVTAFGDFPGAITLSQINGINPTVMRGVNAVGEGQIWAQWQIPGNAASYTFTVTGQPGVTAYSIDRLVVDTHWSSAAPPDIAAPTTPPVAHVMSAVSGAVTPSTRGNPQTTWFGWETFNNINNRTMGVSVINDSTPDIGTTTTAGANFQTTNGEGHLLSSGNIYFFAGTLAEQITVPTNGTVSSGFTTVLLQIVSAQGFGAFADRITLSSIEGVAPQIVQSLNATGTGQLWAKWQIPGNQPTYTISIAGPPNQAHFSFDRVIVDTHWSATGYEDDSMAENPPSITTAAVLPIGGVNVPYVAQLAGTGGTAPYTFSTTAGTLPAGLTLTSAGLVEGSPTAVGTANFTVQITDSNGLTATKALEISVTTTPEITTATLANALSGAAYNVSLAATGGTLDYTWSVSEGSLPTGLSLSSAGQITGTPTVAGTFAFTVKVEDANGFTDTQALSLTLINLTVSSASTLPGAVRNVGYSVTLTATGGTTPYAWTLNSGTLPAGLTLSETGVISGTPTATGTATFTVRLADAVPFAVTKEFTLTVTDRFIAPVLHPVSFPAIAIGTAFSHPITAANYPRTFTATGLPKGLKIAPTTGLITGRPEVTGVFNVQLQAANTGGKSPIRVVPLIVRALDPDLVGHFVGLVGRDATANRQLGSRWDLVVTTRGSYTLKVTTGSKAVSARGFLAASAPQVSLSVQGQPLELSLNDTTGQVTGTHGGATLRGWRNAWNLALRPASGRVGYYSLGLALDDEDFDGVASVPQGTGFATFTVSAAGVATFSGLTAERQKITCSSPMGAAGELAFYASLNAGKGSLFGEPILTEDETGSFVGNTIAGSLDWMKGETVSRSYAAAFGPVTVAAEGGYLAPTAKSGLILGLPEAGAAQLVFTDGGLEASQTDPDISVFFSAEAKATFPAINPAKVSLSLNKATGALSGKWTLTETAPPLVRKDVKFQGQIVRSADGARKAVGFFLLPQIPTNGQRPSTTPILSGGFMLQQ